MAEFAYEIVGPAAANGWQTGGYDTRITSAAAAWRVVASIAKHSDPDFAATLRDRTAAGAVDHDGTQYRVTRIA